MKEIQENRQCIYCNEETLHIVSEDALSITYHCSKCNEEEEIVKNFF